MYERARVTIRVASLERSMDYYMRKLGFTLKARGGTRMAELEAAGLTLLLHEKYDGQPDKVPSGVITISLEVSDIEKARRELESRGVEFEGETVEAGGMRIAFTTDPDGVPLLLLDNAFVETV